MPSNDAPPGAAQAPALSLAQKLNEKASAVERIASVRGRTATMAEFTPAIDKHMVRN